MIERIDRECDVPLGSRGYGGNPGSRERLETLVERLEGRGHRRCLRRKQTRRSVENNSVSYSIAKHVGSKELGEIVTYGWDDNRALDDNWLWHDDLVVGDWEPGLDLVLDQTPWAHLTRVDQERGMAVRAGAVFAWGVDVAAPDSLGHVLAHGVLSTVFDTHVAVGCGHWVWLLWEWFVDDRQSLVKVEFRIGVIRGCVRFWN